MRASSNRLSVALVLVEDVESFSFFPMGPAVTDLKTLYEGVICEERLSLRCEADIEVMKTTDDTLG